MRIALVQAGIDWSETGKNNERTNRAVNGNPGADLYLLPEMFSTGFNGICEKDPAESLGTMKELAARNNCAVAGSIAVELDSGLKVNRFYFVTPDSVTYYDKRHLFSYGGEHLNFTGGTERTVVQWKGIRFLLTVCYDLRFPVWSRNRRDYDVMLCVASWPVQRRYAWDTLLRARAIENQCFVAAVNRVGDDPSCHYNGGSVLLDPWGREIAGCPDGEESVITGEIKMESLAELRRTFPVLDDADNFVLSV
ncbi:MAG: nitrilase family protein [Bacteroidales bacterium]|nr:nitrilase family protein [Bacteroidales bacterium]